MKKIIILVLVLLPLGMSTTQAQDLRRSIEKGIASSNALVEAHNWSDAFSTLRNLDATIGEGHPELHYLVSKQRYTLYKRINRHNDVRTHLSIMENYAKNSKDTKVIEDMLQTKASYLSAIGNQQGSRDCYKEIFQMRSKGADLDVTEKCFKDMIQEAKENNNASMSDIISQMYTTWQDSIASVRAAAELKKLQSDYATLQKKLESKESKITGQWASIIFLIVLAIGLAVALVFFILMLIKNVRTTRRLRADLKLSNENNAQKTTFISNISKQISPSLEEIAKGNKQHITALQGMLQHIERYMNMENTPSNTFETYEENIAVFCEEVAAHAECGSIPVTVDAQKLSFPIAKDTLAELLSILLHEASLSKDTERMTLGFKKRNPHTAQFVVSAIGLKYTPEEKEQLFTAFSQVYDLCITDGLSLPTCALIAHKMGGSLTLDNDFAKGTRFVVEVHC